MTEKPDSPPRKPDSNEERKAREAAALRANLLKRKTQQRQREDAKEKPEA